MRCTLWQSARLLQRLGMLCRAVVVSIALALAVAGPASAADGAADLYRLGANDKIRLTVFGESDLSGEFQVSGSGVLALPLVGQVDVGGMTTTEAEARVALRLTDGFLKSPQVSIEVMNYRPFYIIGEINSPGSYPFVDGMKVLSAVALGGGFTYRADKKDIKVRREVNGQKQEFKIQIDASVQPGDVIEVGERFF